MRGECSSSWAMTARRGNGPGLPRLRVPQPRAQERLGAVEEDRLDLDLEREDRPLAPDRHGVEVRRVVDEPGPPVDPQGVAPAGDEEVEADVRVGQHVAVAVDPPVARALGDRDGVRSSTTCTSCPGGSPLGLASQRPSASEVASTQNGVAASQARSMSVSADRSLVDRQPGRQPDDRLELLDGGDLHAPSLRYRASTRRRSWPSPARRSSGSRTWSPSAHSTTRATCAAGTAGTSGGSAGTSYVACPRRGSTTPNPRDWPTGPCSARTSPTGCPPPRRCPRRGR